MRHKPGRGHPGRAVEPRGSAPDRAGCGTTFCRAPGRSDPRAGQGMSQSAEDRVSPGAADTLRAAIREASGQEVFFLGRIDETGKLTGLSVAAPGNEAAGPANTPQGRGG